MLIKGQKGDSVGNEQGIGVDEVAADLVRHYGNKAWKVADQQLALAQDVDMITRWQEIADRLAR